MGRLKLRRFKVKQPTPEVLAYYLRVYLGRELHYRPESLPPITSSVLFGNDQPLNLDLGCGRGEFLAAQAQQRPHENFVGIDWNLKSLWDAINRAEQGGLKNVRFIKADVRQILDKVPDATIQEVYLLFPPPKLKPNERKADPLSAAMLHSSHRIMVPEGAFHFVTDHAAYFEQKQALIEASGLFNVLASSRRFEGGQTRFQLFWENFEIESRRLECQKPPTGLPPASAPE